MKIVALLLSLVFLLSTSCQTLRKKAAYRELQNKKMTWARHPNQTGDLAGFRVYLGTKGKKKDLLLADIKDPKATEVYLQSFSDKLDPYGANYLYLTAYDYNNNESEPSGKTCWGKGCKKNREK